MATQNKSKGNPDDSQLEEEMEPKAAQKEVDSDAGDETPDAESLVEILHGDVTEIEPGAAIDQIDLWVNFLKGHKEENIKEVSSSLKELKKLLKGKKSEASEIAEVLSQLGEQTNAIGDEAERGVKGPLHKVGKALIQAAGKIEKMADKAESK
ncbi:hypothetical protein [Phormidesmis priestleyi]